MSFLGKLVISGPSIATTEVLDELNMLRDNDYVTTIPTDSGPPKWAATQNGVAYYNSFDIYPENQEYTAIKPVESDPAASALGKQVAGDHYSKMKIQPVEYIHANNIPFIEGCIIKYVSRYKGKNGKQDLLKAKHFIDMLIELEYPE